MTHVICLLERRSGEIQITTCKGQDDIWDTIETLALKVLLGLGELSAALKTSSQEKSKSYTPKSLIFREKIRARWPSWKYGRNTNDILRLIDMLKLKTCSTYAHYSKSYIYVNKINFAKTLLLKISKKQRSHSTLRAKRATFTFWVDKSYLKRQKWSILAIFWKPEGYGQTVLPDSSLF